MTFWQQLFALFHGREIAELERWPTNEELAAESGRLERALAESVLRGGPAWTESNLRRWLADLPSPGWLEEFEEIVAEGAPPQEAGALLARAYLRRRP